MPSALDQVRENFGPPPRSLGWFRRFYLLARVPYWMPRDDDLMEIFRQQKLLLRHGDIVWGAIVQANNMIFAPGPYDHPATVVYSRDKFFENRPTELAALAGQLFMLKGTKPQDREERRYADMLTGEMERAMGWLAPRSLTGKRMVRSTTIMIFRKHLPDGYLTEGYFPLLMHADTSATMIVPSRFWPIGLL